MFDKTSAYKYYLIGGHTGYFSDQFKNKIYAFKVHLKDQLTNNRSKKKNYETYYVIIAEFKHNLGIIKFYPKSLETSGDNKFKATTNRFLFNRILATVLVIVQHHLSRNPGMSFAFQGAPKQLKNGELEPLKKTQRYRIYEHAVRQVANPDTFTQIRRFNDSIYGLVNKSVADPAEYVAKCKDMLSENSGHLRELFGN